MTDRIVTDADRAPMGVADFTRHMHGVGEPGQRVGPADQYLEAVLDIMLKLGYSELEISSAIETIVYRRKQYGL